MADISEQVRAFIDYKNGLGFSFEKQEQELRRFACFAKSIGHSGPIDAELACKWARSGGVKTRQSEASRYEQVRMLSDYCRVFDGTLPQLPPRLLGKSHVRIEPYIYSDEDVRLLMHAAGATRGTDPLKALTYRFLIGLLRATGMRPAEAYRLTDKDLDEDERTIFIQKSKGRPRLLPVSESTFEAIISYKDQRDLLRPHHKCPNLLISTSGDSIISESADQCFQEYRSILLKRGEVWERRPPRLYDLRHSFCCWTIIGWYEDGRDVASLIPALSNYMGHEQISYTYWYMSSVPRLLSIACEAFGQTAMPEVFFDE